ncbi:hypothetical protein ACXYTJ_03520 [Gilvimarinus sp. F26214L]|uniref:hypothetical protein n=1 Tax=Gilvimarinus sp. DZF01 TaxID=3461371 RepID=UPI004045C644
MSQVATTLLGACLLLAAGTIAAEGYQVPRLPDGTPDFQGIWRNSTATPLERDPSLGDRRAFSEAEAAAIRAAALNRVNEDAKPTDPDAPPPKAEALPPVGNYNLFWTDRGMSVAQINGEYRTSMIIDPPDGRIPPLTESARERRKAGRGPGRSDGPEGRSLGERCLLSFGSLSGPPMLPVMYNSHYQFVQTPGYMMILVEMVHDVRLIRIGEDLEHDQRRKWMGDSIGHWEGDTLVVETTNFRPEQSFRGSSPDMVVTERFTRVADDKIVYRFTVEDPAAFERPFTGELPFTTTDEQIYEYACHEGNYGLPGILGGARREEREAPGAGRN